MMARGLRWVLLTAAILSAWASPAYAQAIGSIFGKVTDASGAVLPGVTVTVTGTGLQQPLVAVTSESGTYQFPSVPTGTYTVTFELASFKKGIRNNIVLTSGFNAGVDQKLEVGALTEEVTVSSASPVVDLKKTITGATFDLDTLEKIPTARDPWQIVNMAPGVQLSGYNVGGSLSGQQLTPSVRGSSANVQWNLEGGSITDLSSNSSALYYNFDSFDQIQVTTGGGDVSVQSAGLAINLITKSGSNVFKGTFNGTFENDSMQGNNVTEELFTQGAGGFLSGNPLNRISVYSIEAGGPLLRDRLWYWGAWDHQDINAGVANFFDPTKGSFCQDLIAAQNARTLSIGYDQLEQVTGCLKNDKTVIKDIQGKVNYQLNQANRVGYLFLANDKVRNARGASSTTTVEATTQQFSDKPWGFPNPTHQLQHTLVATDKLVFNNMFTYLGGGFFLDYQDFETYGESRYLASPNSADYLAVGNRSDAAALWNQQSLTNRTTGVASRAITATYQTVRPSWEIKTDGTYFLTNKFGGDHSLKFGVGWRRAPILSFSHYSGGGRAHMQCVGNTLANCGENIVAPGTSTTGLVPYQAVLYRDQIRDNDWWTYNGYLQDSFSKGRWRINGGIRYDWQQSKHLGGCVPENVIRPDLLPSQCDEETMVDSVTGRKIQAFGNWSPRASVTYDLLGDGKTSIRATGSYFYATKITLANALTGLFTQTTLTWGPNPSTGLCSTTAGASCWNDANRDSKIQPNELIGEPTASSTRFINGVLAPAGNIVDESAQIGRTREGIIGVQHELIENLAIGVDYIYRKYDRGTTTYSIGYEPGGPSGSLSALYTGPLTHTDPTSGLTGEYYVICDGCSRPQGLGQITVTDPNYQVYHGVDITATKRYSNNWQMQVALTLQTNPQYFPDNSASFINPTNREFRDGYSTIPRYNFKANGSYTFKWDINASANLNVIEGAARSTSINGPGQVYGGVNASGAATTINYGTAALDFEPRGTTRFEPVKLLDLGVQKAFRFSNSKYQLKLMFDAFNVFNINTVTSYSSSNRSQATYSQVTGIIAPRVYRVGMRVSF
jgi:hypothetical protein